MINRQPRIKLIFPCRFEVNDPYHDPLAIHLPYGMGVLTAYLKKHGAYVEQDDLSVKFNARGKHLKEVRSVDLRVSDSFKKNVINFFKTGELTCRLERFVGGVLSSTSIRGFDIIGFSVFTHWHFIFALMLSSQIKKHIKTPIVFGGPCITLYGKFFPEAFKIIDFMIAGEGEKPLIELARALIQKTSFERVPGLIYKRERALSMVAREEYLIEEMCMPDFEGLPLKLYRGEQPQERLYVPFQISKGCNGACGFCVTKRIDPFLKYKSYGKVVTELRLLKEKYESNFFHFCDSSINSSCEYLEGLCKEFIDNRINIYWRTYAKVERLDREVLRKLKAAGCETLIFGIESGSDRVLRLMRKGFTSNQAQMILRDSAELGIKNSVCFMSGYHHEGEADIRHTVDFIRRNKKYIYHAQVNPFQLAFGSDMWEHPEVYGITNPKESKPRILFTFDEIGGLRWQEKRIQQAHSNKQIIRAFRKHLVQPGLLRSLIYFVRTRLDIKRKPQTAG